MKCHLTTLNMSTIKEKKERKRMTNVGKDVEKLESLFIANRDVN